MTEKIKEDFADYRSGRTSYFKVDRNIVESSLWTMPDTDIRVFIYLLAKANWEPKKWWDKEKKAEVLIPRGSFITSIGKIADANAKSKATIQHCLIRLIKTGRIKKSGTAYSFISIINYDYYQQEYKKDDTLDIRQPNASDTPVIREVVTTKEVKKYRSIEDKKDLIDIYVKMASVLWKVWLKEVKSSKDDSSGANARKYIIKHLKDGITKEDLISAVMSYGRWCKKNDRSPEMRKNCANFFSPKQGNMWKDFMVGGESYVEEGTSTDWGSF